MVRRLVLSILLLGVAFCNVSRAQTPVSVSIHGPSTVYESANSEYRLVVLWSDGTKSAGVAAWSASWASANPAFLFISPFSSVGTLTTGNVGNDSGLTINATYIGPTGPLNAIKSVTVLDASSYPSVSIALLYGWNLLGNSIGAPLNVVATFGNPLQPGGVISSAVVSVWKWDGVNGKWAFYSPWMTPVQNAAYAAAKGHSVLHVVHPGEGYWVNTTGAATLPARSGAPMAIGSTSIVNGWNLIATGQQMGPSQFNALLSAVPPAPGTVPENFVTLWGWDPALARWIFYSPNLEASGGLAAVKAYADAHGYLDFPTLGRELGHGVGFWVNSTTPNANSNLTPLGQAKAMFSELRTTVRAYSNDLKSGFLDPYVTRVSDELTGNVAPQLPWALHYADLLIEATGLFEDISGGNTFSYQVQPGVTGGTVRASRLFFSGSEQISCFSNDMAGAQVTPGLLTTASCTWMDFNSSAYTYIFPDRTQLTQRVDVTAGATSNDFNYAAFKRQRLETWNGSFFAFVSNAQIGPTRTGSFSRTYLGATGNVSNFSFVGDLPPRGSVAVRDTVNLLLTRAVQNAGTSTYRYNISGSVTSKDSGGAALVTFNLANGSYFDAREDALGYGLPNSEQALHVVGTAQTATTRFTGTIDLGAFAADADNAEYWPASIAFSGMFEDLAAGGAGIFLTGNLTVTLNNLALYHSLQAETAGNFLSGVTAFVGKIQSPGRPEMQLTAGSTRTGVDSYSITSNYTYGPVSVTGTGTLDTFNTDNSTLTITNQDGVTVSIQPHADAVVSKGGTTLGVIPFGSTIVHFIDGYFESL